MSSYLLASSPSPSAASDDNVLASVLRDNDSSESTTVSSMVNVSSNDEIIAQYISESRRKGATLLIMYIILYVIGSSGNLIVLYNITKRQYRSKVNFYIIQLAIADLIVINCTVLTEIGWRITVQWVTGEVGCKFFQFLRIFGLYLTSNIVICITLDRFFAFVFPLSVFKSNERNRHLLNASYALAFLSSIPNAFVFHVQEHPHMKGYYQCMTAGYFDQAWKEIFYNSFTLVMMYFVPLIFIIVCYSIILKNITQTTGNCVANKTTTQGNENESIKGGTPGERANTAIYSSRRNTNPAKLIERLYDICLSLFGGQKPFSRQFSDTESGVDPVPDQSMHHDKTGVMINQCPDSAEFDSKVTESPSCAEYNGTKRTLTQELAINLTVESPSSSINEKIDDSYEEIHRISQKDMSVSCDKEKILVSPDVIESKNDESETINDTRDSGNSLIAHRADNVKRLNEVINVSTNVPHSKQIMCDILTAYNTAADSCMHYEQSNVENNSINVTKESTSDITQRQFVNGEIDCSKNKSIEFSPEQTPLKSDRSTNVPVKCVKFRSDTPSESVKLLNVMKRNRSESTISQFSSSVHSERRTVIMARAKKRTLIMSILIVVTFCICWTPYSFMLAVEVCNIKSIHIPNELKGLLYWFAICNSVLNPFVHSYHIFVNVFCKKLHRGSERQTETSTSQRRSYSPGANLGTKFKFDESFNNQTKVMHTKNNSACVNDGAHLATRRDSTVSVNLTPNSNQSTQVNLVDSNYSPGVGVNSSNDLAIASDRAIGECRPLMERENSDRENTSECNL